MRQRTGLQFYILLTALIASAHALAETTQRVETINGVRYTVQYSLQPDGKLKVLPTHILSTTGWVYLGDNSKFKVDPKHLKGQGSLISINGRSFSVRFSDSNGRTLGEPYAEWKNGKWEYIEPSSPANDAATRSEAIPSQKEAASASVQKSNSDSASKAVPVASFRVYQPAVKSFSASANETQPYLEDGHWVYPNINLNAQARIADSPNSIHLDVTVGVSGEANSSGGKRVLGRMSGANVTTYPSAATRRSIYMSQSGVTAGPSQTLYNQMPYTVQPYTEFRMPLLRRGALRKARQQAQSQVQAKIPQQQGKLIGQLNRGVDEAVDKVNQNIRQGLTQLSGFSEELQNNGATLPFGVHLSSKSGDTGGYAEVTLTGPASTAIKPQPTLPVTSKTAASLQLHEQAVNEAIAPLLAGKRINLGEAIRLICNHRFMQRFDICEKPDPTAEKTELEFDDTEPFRIRFQDNQVKLELNAAHHVADLSAVNAHRVEITYAVTPAGLRRKSIVATARNAASASEATHTTKQSTENTPSGTHAEPKPSTSSAALSFFNQALRSFASPVEKMAIETAYSRELRENVEFPEVKVPSQIHVQNAKAGGAPNVVGHSGFRPVKTVAADGWLMMGYELAQ
jgi:hypothetical protein